MVPPVVSVPAFVLKLELLFPLLALRLMVLLVLATLVTLARLVELTVTLLLLNEPGPVTELVPLPFTVKGSGGVIIIGRPELALIIFTLPVVPPVEILPAVVLNMLVFPPVLLAKEKALARFFKLKRFKKLLRLNVPIF